MDSIKFAVFTDLHYDHVPDGDRRIKEFMCKVNKAGIDFIIGLGDICYPIEENRVIVEELKKAEVPCYFTIGNHDTDMFSKEQAMRFLCMKNSYYSFIKGNTKFIVLDACFIKKGDGYIPYCKKNYNKDSDSYPYIPPKELSWLENELNDKCEHYIIFSHHSLANEFGQRGVFNREEVKSILDKANGNGKRVLMCMNGHDHGNAAVVINGICYYTLNAMSYIWHGIKETYNYSKEIHERYPYLKDMIMYQDGLHAIVTITGDGQLKIEGMKGNYQNITPSDVGIGNNLWNGVSIEPIVLSINT